MNYSVYMLRCSDGSYYTGYTKSIEKRLGQHKEGNGSRYTRSRLPIRLVYSEKCKNRAEAMRREFKIKRMSRKEKEELIQNGTKFQ